MSRATFIATAGYVLATLLLAGCDQEPRQPIVPHDQALNDHRPLVMRVVKIFDASEYPVDDINISQLIEVEILAGSDHYNGEIITLPYDEWMTGKPPPMVGTRVVASPSDWVRRNPNSRGDAMPEFQR